MTFDTLSDLYNALNSGAYSPKEWEEIANLTLKIYQLLEDEPTELNAGYAGGCMAWLMKIVSKLDKVPVGLPETIVVKLSHMLDEFGYLFSDKLYKSLFDMLKIESDFAEQHRKEIKENDIGQSIAVLRRVVHNDDWHKDFFEIIFPDVKDIPMDGNIPPRYADEMRPQAQAQQTPPPGGNDVDNPFPRPQPENGDDSPYSPRHVYAEATLPPPPGGGNGGNRLSPDRVNGGNPPPPGGGKVLAGAVPPPPPSGGNPPPPDKPKYIRPDRIDIHKLLAIAVLKAISSKMVRVGDNKFQLVLKSGIDSTKYFEYGHEYLIRREKDNRFTGLLDMTNPPAVIEDGIPLNFYAAHYLEVLGAAPQFDIDGNIIIDNMLVEMKSLGGVFPATIELARILDDVALYSLATILSPLSKYAVKYSADTMQMHRPGEYAKAISPESRAFKPYTVYAARDFYDTNVRQQALTQSVSQYTNKTDYGM